MTKNKTRSKKTPKKADKKKPQDGSMPESEGNVSEDKVFDFGGIPARDLKKNLGCG